jgi:hypothetical protein
MTAGPASGATSERITKLPLPIVADAHPRMRGNRSP